MKPAKDGAPQVGKGGPPAAALSLRREPAAARKVFCQVPVPGTIGDRELTSTLLLSLTCAAMKPRLPFWFAVVLFNPFLLAQQQRVPTAKPPALPADMECEKLKDDKEVPSNRSSTILKRGTNYYLCQPKSQSVLAKARTAAVAVRSTQTISCGDGSSSDCIREDTRTERTIEDLTNRTDLWRYFEEVPPAKADIIIQFIANERASSSAQIVLRVQDSDSGTWAYYESRPITDFENDVNKLVDHFIAKSGQTPRISKEAMEKARQCTRVTDQLNTLKADFKKRLSAYEFKNSHLLDAQMEECKLHWKDWVCLERGGGNSAKEWNEVGQELNRKQLLEFDELNKLAQQIKDFSQAACSSQGAVEK